MTSDAEDHYSGFADSAINLFTRFGHRVQESMVKISYDPPCPSANNILCEVKQSNHGRGVFATRDIKKGETVTLYPAHNIATPLENGRHDITGICQYEYEYAVTHPKTGERHTGDKMKEDPFFLGHLINDFCSFVGEFKEKAKGQGETMMKYLLHAETFQNVEFKAGMHFISIKASKDIKEGEELLITYTPCYWTKLSCMEVLNQTREYMIALNKTNPKKALFLETLLFKLYSSRKY